jgi:virulence factor Mce-like protein
MVKQAPTFGRLLTMALFALSCFGLLLFLWSAFGGPVPLQAKGYRFKVAFNEATQLSGEADVRISGVSVGKVVTETRSGQRTLATIQLKPRYAPLPEDSRAILRLKTLLGETYVELTPGSDRAPKLPENGRLANSQVADTVELDEVLRAFDPKTRTDLRNWVVNWASTVRGRGADFNAAIGNLAPTVANGADLLGVLDTERSALASLVRNTGKTFGALGSREAQTRSLITAGNKVFTTTKARNADLEQTFKILPAFVKGLKPTLTVVQAAALDAAPVFRVLRPSAPLLYPALRDTSALSPDLKAAFKSLDPALTAARAGLPAATRTLRGALPLLQILDPVGRDLAPVVDYLGLYKSDFMQSWENVSAATQATTDPPGSAKPVHYLRAIAVVDSDLLMGASRRSPSNRTNPYPAPDSQLKLATGLDSYTCAHTGNAPLLPPILSAPKGCNVQKSPTVQGRNTAFPQMHRAAP